MIRDLDATLEAFLVTYAEPNSALAQAAIRFDLPDAEWRADLEVLTVNCYLHDVRENREMRTTEMYVQRTADGTRAVRRQPPVRIDCAYCISAWSPATENAVLEEHRVLSQVLALLLKYPRIPADVLRGSLTQQLPPYPTVIAAPNGLMNPPEFWGALDQPLKPSLNYVITLGMPLDGDATPGPVVDEIVLDVRTDREVAG